MDDWSDAPERLFERAIYHFERAEWEEARDALVAMRAAGYDDPRANELLADLELKLRLTGGDVRFREVPKQRCRPPLALLIGGPVAALAVVGISAALLLRQPEPVAAVVAAPTTATTPTAVPPTAVPPTAVPPTATATPLPPTATAIPVTATPALAAAPGLVAVMFAEGQDALTQTTANIELILDGSGSMRQLNNERRKIELAREAVSGLVISLPEETRFALRTYGTQRSDDCADLSLVQPLQSEARDALLAKIAAIEPAPEGRTPMGASLRAAGEDLQGAEGGTALILVSDGDESCDSDPVGAARARVEQYPDVRVHVVGFDIDQEKATELLRAIAEAGRGQYFPASDATQLTNALREAIQLPYQIVDGDGGIVASGFVGGSALTVPAGDYQLVLVGQASTPLDIRVDGDTPVNVAVVNQDGVAQLVAAE